MNIGTLKANEADIHMGRITTLSIAVFVALSPVNSTNEKAPAFDVMALARRQAFLGQGRRAVGVHLEHHRRGIPVGPH